MFGPSGHKALLLDFFLAGTQLTLGSAMYSRTLLDFDESFQLDCLLKVCTEWLNLLSLAFSPEICS